jgi:hypothetical protein
MNDRIGERIPYRMAHKATYCIPLQYYLASSCRKIYKTLDLTLQLRKGL